MQNRPRTVWSWIVATLVGLPVLYVLSFGPACWTVRWTKQGEEVLAAVYAPLLPVWADGPRGLSNALDFYANTPTSLENRLMIFELFSSEGDRILTVRLLDATGPSYMNDPFL